MGQAKRRGTFEERRQESIERAIQEEDKFMAELFSAFGFSDIDPDETSPYGGEEDKSE